ncbi:MAG: cation:proton antiporter [Oscillospiraceae bacterium]|nr:cation:proton antiporter [Oscillospiraceae bacterium]MBR3848875.1 cation:proton antiporter [Oscillospiraceae bacterium]
MLTIFTLIGILNRYYAVHFAERRGIVAAYFDPSSPTAVIISISLMLFCGYAMTRIANLIKLPSVTAYLLAGILIGPQCLDLIPAQIIGGMDFLADIALAFIAFSTGEFFRVAALRQNGAKVVVITLLEALTAAVLVFVAVHFLLGLNLLFSIVVAALAAATAPASTMMTIRQTGAKGDFVNTLLQVIALDNLVALLTFSIAISVVHAAMSGNVINLWSILEPLGINLGVMLLGVLFGLVMKWLLSKRSTDNRLIIAVALLFAFCGICALLSISPLLGCMSMGMIYINLTGDDKLFKQLNYFSPPLLLMFFVRSGLNFRIDALFGVSGGMDGASLLVICLMFFVFRFIGKYVGAFAGCAVVKKPKLVRNYLGLALIPQASVAIGLASLGARTLGGDMGSALHTVILAASILFELVGPACAKLSLYLSKSYATLEDVAPVEEVTATGEVKSAAQLLVERIQKIQKELPPPKSYDEENEQAFLDAAEEQQQALRGLKHNNLRRRRIF